LVTVLRDREFDTSYDSFENNTPHIERKMKRHKFEQFLIFKFPAKDMIGRK